MKKLLSKKSIIFYLLLLCCYSVLVICPVSIDAILHKKEVKQKTFTTHSHFCSRLFSKRRPTDHLDNWNQTIHPDVAIKDNSIQLAVSALTGKTTILELCVRSREPSVTPAATQSAPLAFGETSPRAKDMQYKHVAVSTDEDHPDDSPKDLLQEREGSVGKMYKEASTMTSVPQTIHSSLNFS